MYKISVSTADRSVRLNCHVWLLRLGDTGLGTPDINASLPESMSDGHDRLLSEPRHTRLDLCTSYFIVSYFVLCVSIRWVLKKLILFLGERGINSIFSLPPSIPTRVFKRITVSFFKVSYRLFFKKIVSSLEFLFSHIFLSLNVCIYKPLYHVHDVIQSQF